MFWRFFFKNIDVDVFDDVLQNAKHRANDASNDVNRPPLNGGDLALADFKWQDKYRAKRKQVLSGGWGGEVALDSQRYNLIDLHIP